MSKQIKIFLSEDFIEVELSNFAFRFFSGNGMWIDFTKTRVCEMRESRTFKEFHLLGTMINYLIRHYMSEQVATMLMEYQIALNELDLYS